MKTQNTITHESNGCKVILNLDTLTGVCDWSESHESSNGTPQPIHTAIWNAIKKAINADPVYHTYRSNFDKQKSYFKFVGK